MEWAVLTLPDMRAISVEWAVLTLPGMRATSVVRELAHAVGMVATLLRGPVVLAFGVAVLATMPGTGATRHGNWHGHDHDHFVHDHRFHDHFNNRFVAVGIGGWWPGYYGYGYGYGGCGWLYNEALVTGSPYWWTGTTVAWATTNGEVGSACLCS